MAVLNRCKYCSGMVCDAPWHEKCRLALAENLLAEIKQVIAEGKVTDMPHAIWKNILSEDWRKAPPKKTLDEFLREGALVPGIF